MIGMRIGAAALVGITLLATAGCARVANLPGVYRLDVRQGNAFDERRLARLELGMSREKVVELIGTPAIRDPFNPDRWDYAYTFSPEGRKGTERRITLHFEDEELVRIDGAIDAGATPEDSPRPARVVRVPPRPPDTGLWGRLLGRDENQ